MSVALICSALSLTSCRSFTEWTQLIKQSTPSKPVISVDPTQANAELLHEMFTVVFLKEPGNKVEFGDFVNALNQGASLEGLFNGFTHSAFYRRLEEDPETKAFPATLELFYRELFEVEQAELERRNFVMADGLPLAKAMEPSSLETPPSPVTAQPSSDLLPDVTRVKTQSEKEFSIIFASSSFFTLKRVLSDELLRLIDARSEKDLRGLREWLAHWSVRLAREQVDFGLPSRGSLDLEFHRRWIEQATPDRLKWEALNRVQRLINVSESRARSPSKSATPQPSSSSKRSNPSQGR